MLRKKYFIWYRDKTGKEKNKIIKAKNEESLTKKFYKQNPYALIEKISLC